MRRLPGSHVPNIRNRSSKHLGWLTGIRPIVRSVSTATLREWAAGDKNGKHKCWAAVSELDRRNKLHAKKGS